MKISPSIRLLAISSFLGAIFPSAWSQTATMAGDELGRLRNQVNQLSIQRQQQGPVDVYIRDGRSYYEKQFDAQMQMEQLQLKKQALDSADQQRQQRNQQEYDRRLDQEVNQVYDVYYKALNDNISDLVICGTCGSMYESVYKHSHPLIQEALQRTVNDRVAEIQSKISSVNLADAQLEARGLAMFTCLNNAKKGGDTLQYYEPIVREMYTEIKGLFDNQATRDTAFGSTIYKDWSNFNKQMKGALLAPLTPAEKEASKASTTEAQKRFQDLLAEAKSVGVSNKTIMKALMPLTKKIDASWGEFDSIVQYRESEFNRLVLESANGDPSKKAQVINDQALIEKIRAYIEAETVVKICVSDLPKSDELRQPAEATLKILINEAKVNGGGKQSNDDLQLLSSTDQAQYNKVQELLNLSKEKKIPFYIIEEGLAPIYDKIADGEGEGVLKVKAALPDYYNHYDSKAKAMTNNRPSNDMVIKVSKGNLILDLCKQNYPEGSIAREEVIKDLPSIIEKGSKEPGATDPKVKLAEYKAKLDACDQALFKALNVSTNNLDEKHKTAIHFIGKLAPYYEDLKTNVIFIGIDKARQDFVNEFVRVVGAKDYDDLTRYCSSNNICIDDLIAYIKGEGINQAAYCDSPVSDYARQKYIETSELSIKNPSSFYSTPYKNYESLNDLLIKHREYSRTNASGG